MKISEVRSIIDGYSQDQLKLIIAQLYKTIPKAIKEENDIDSLLKNPDGPAQSTPKTGEKELPNIELLKNNAELFLENAYKQSYFAPNRFVNKRDRPKWRFIVKRLYKEIMAAGADESNAPEAANLLEKLYKLLCYSCSYTLFSCYDPFQSAGIEQVEFFRRVLALKFRCENHKVFIKNALLLSLNHSLNRYTLHQDLMEAILEFTKTPDQKELAITMCSELIEAIKKEAPSRKDHFTDFEKREKLNTLATMAFLCYTRLYDYANAISYFKANYHESDQEFDLYVLLKLLAGLGQKDHFLKEYEKAVERGIIPRASLKETYRSVKESGRLPANWRH